MKEKGKKRKLSLLLTICIMLFLLCMVTCVAVFGVVTNQTHRMLVENAGEDLIDTANEAISGLEKQLAVLKDRLLYLTENNRIISYLKYYDEQAPLTRYNMERSIQNLIENAAFLDSMTLDILIMNRQTVLNNMKWGTLDPGFPDTEPEWYLRMEADPKFQVFVVNLSFYKNSRLSNMNAVGMGLPVFSYDGTYVGAVFLFLDAEALRGIPLGSKEIKSDEAYYLVNSKDEIIVSFSSEGDDSIAPARLGDLPLLSLQTFCGMSNDVLLNMDEVWVEAEVFNNDCRIIAYRSLMGIHEQLSALKIRDIAIILMTTLLTCLLFAGVYLFLNKKMHAYLEYLVEIETFNAQPKEMLFQEADDLAQKFHHLVKDLRTATERNYTYELEHSRMRLDTLIAQINPHFLFNTLQFLQSEIMYGDRKRANGMLLSLSRLFRFSLDTKEYVSTVQEEIAFTRDYLSICQQCYAGQLDVRIEVDPELYPLIVPKFFIQPIAENSIKHGFGGTPYQGSLSILGKRDRDTIVFTIEDNGHGISPAALDELRASIDGIKKENGSRPRIGLANIRQRLKLFFGERFSMWIESDENRFFRVTIVIPVITSDQRP